jgi:hypothetical protein
VVSRGVPGRPAQPTGDGVREFRLLAPQAYAVAHPRFQTQPCSSENSGEDGGSGEVCGKLVVSCCNAPPVFEAAEHPPGQIALLPGAGIERVIGSYGPALRSARSR